jgi:hypothetical protein
MAITLTTDEREIEGEKERKYKFKIIRVCGVLCLFLRFKKGLFSLHKFGHSVLIANLSPHKFGGFLKSNN